MVGKARGDVESERLMRRILRDDGDECCGDGNAAEARK